MRSDSRLFDREVCERMLMFDFDRETVAVGLCGGKIHRNESTTISEEIEIGTGWHWIR